MSANKNVRVCVITSPGLLVEVDADRADRKATGLCTRRGPNIIRPPPLRSRKRPALPGYPASGSDGSDPDRSNRCRAIAGDAGGRAVRGDRDGTGDPGGRDRLSGGAGGGVNGCLTGARAGAGYSSRGVSAAA